MTKFGRKNVPGERIDHGAPCIQSGFSTDFHFRGISSNFSSLFHFSMKFMKGHESN